MDTANQVLPSASIVILRQSDSTMVNFGLADRKGEFQININIKGAYLIQYSFLGYQTILLPIKTTWEQKKISLPDVRLQKSDFQLPEVNITAEPVPLRLEGNTLIYDAEAFETRVGDNVEQLLELLMGISIDNEGNLIAQGKKVDKVLVNGKDFFGKDINIATKNLEAKIIKNIEVFDKKSENAEFTGIDDGNEKRTINLELKEEYKKGCFGKLEAALGTEETYNSRVNYNQFNESTQFSALGNTNNINQRGLGAISDLNSSASQGVTDVIVAGLNLSHEFNSSLSTRTNYSFIQNKNIVTNEILTKNFIDSSTFITNEIRQSKNKKTRHQLNSNLKWKINKQTETSIQANFNFSDQTVLKTSSTLYDPPIIGNLVTNNVNQADEQLDIFTSINLRKKFAKKGRSWLTNYLFNRVNKQEETILDNTIFDQRLTQLQTFYESGIVSQINTSYTEPLSEKWFIKGEYNYSIEKNEPSRSFFDIENSTIVLNDSLSSSFQRILNAHDLKLSINRNTKKLTSSAGVGAIETNLRSSGLNRYFKFILPFLNIDYKITPTKSIRFSYLTNSRAPQLKQLLTIQNNTNPNQNYIGNPNLNPEYSHQFRVNYYNFNTSSQLSYNAEVAFNKTIDKIVTQTFVNDDLTSLSMPANSALYESFNVNAGLSGKIQKINIRFRINSSANQNIYDAFLNGAASRIKSQTISTRFIISRAKRETWDINIGVDYSINYSDFEINSDFDQQSFNLFWFVKGEVEITKTILFQCNYRIQRLNDVNFFNGRMLHFVDASLKKTFQNREWEVFLLGNDLLNQNIGVQRSSTLNSLSEQTYNTRQQYFMIGVCKKLGGVSKKSKIE